MTPKPNQPPSVMRYIGNGAFIPGVPARDLTVDEWQAISPELRKQAKDLYAVDTTKEGE